MVLLPLISFNGFIWGPSALLVINGFIGFTNTIGGPDDSNGFFNSKSLDNSNGYITLNGLVVSNGYISFNVLITSNGSFLPMVALLPMVPLHPMVSFLPL